MEPKKVRAVKAGSVKIKKTSLSMNSNHSCEKTKNKLAPVIMLPVNKTECLEKLRAIFQNSLGEHASLIVRRSTETRFYEHAVIKGNRNRCKASISLPFLSGSKIIYPTSLIIFFPKRFAIVFALGKEDFISLCYANFTEPTVILFNNIDISKIILAPDLISVNLIGLVWIKSEGLKTIEKKENLEGNMDFNTLNDKFETKIGELDRKLDGKIGELEATMNKRLSEIFDFMKKKSKSKPTTENMQIDEAKELNVENEKFSKSCTEEEDEEKNQILGMNKPY